MAYTKIRISGHSHGIWNILVENVSFTGPINDAVKDLTERLYQFALITDSKPVVKFEREGICTVIRLANYDAFCVTAYT